ncbi:MAG: LuxR C-terminal-related transcriptional regulator [Muribaculaceae bacterium]|nr:LuxR C-terminal-related transcriptional regulator [Muribaculaceae bacterium]
MSNSERKPLKIVVASGAVILRTGIVSVLKRIPEVAIHPIEVDNREALISCVNMQAPDAVIVDVLFEGWFDVAEFSSRITRGMPRMIALVGGVMAPGALKGYDFVIGLRDDIDSLANIFSQIRNNSEDDSSSASSGENAISTREKEVIVCVVKGMTNKEIADKLFISVHTVVTHRRNLARKLQIHSSAGLTIYAIVNKLVELDEIKNFT